MTIKTYKKMNEKLTDLQQSGTFLLGNNTTEYYKTPHKSEPPIHLRTYVNLAYPTVKQKRIPTTHYEIQSNLSIATTQGKHKSGLCRQVPLVHDSMRNNFQGKQQMRPLQTGGLCRQVVSKAGLTVIDKQIYITIEITPHLENIILQKSQTNTITSDITITYPLDNQQ